MAASVPALVNARVLEWARKEFGVFFVPEPPALPSLAVAVTGQINTARPRFES